MSPPVSPCSAVGLLYSSIATLTSARWLVHFSPSAGDSPLTVLSPAAGSPTALARAAQRLVYIHWQFEVSLRMFDTATSFNEDITSWNIARVRDMGAVLSPLSGWR